jgi:outer membrane protein
MKNVFLFFIFFGLLLPQVFADDLIHKNETLDLNRCISIALKQNPNIQAAVGTFKASESRLGQARSEYYPRITGSASYYRTDPMLTSGNAAAYDAYAASIALSQNLYDFGKTPTLVKIQELNRDSSGLDLENIRKQVTFAVKQAYWGVLRTRHNRDVSREVVDQFNQHLDSAKAFFEAGTRPKIDVTKAEVDLSNAKLDLLKAENTYRIAIVALNNVMGIPEAPDYEVADVLSNDRVEIDLKDALKKAYDRRSDLKAIEVKKISLNQSIALARKEYYPSITGIAGYGRGGTDFPLDEGWNVGAQVNIPLFSGFSTREQIAEAKANLEVLTANDSYLRQAIYQDVKQSWLNLHEAADRIITASLSIRHAEENLDLANGRYASGLGSPLEVTDALVAVSNAKTAHIAALYDYQLAKASLENAMGE